MRPQSIKFNAPCFLPYFNSLLHIPPGSFLGEQQCSTVSGELEKGDGTSNLDCIAPARLPTQNAPAIIPKYPPIIDTALH